MDEDLLAELPFLVRICYGEEPEHRQKSQAPVVNDGAKHCVHMIEAFFIDRGDDSHVCFALELLGSHVTNWRKTFPQNKLVLPLPFTKAVVRQTLLALDYLHSECGIIHCGQFHSHAAPPRKFD